MSKARLFHVLLGAAVFASLFFLLHQEERLSLRDPDRYYHFALSREMVRSGRLFLRQVPQVTGLGWDRYFPDKEFLFHQVTALAYRFGGDQGVILAVWLVALAASLTLYFFAASRAGPWAALLLVGVFFGSPMLMARLLLVRPHVLAILWFVLMLIGALRRAPWLLGLSICLFCLSYHAFFIPLAVLASAGVACFLAGELAGIAPEADLSTVGDDEDLREALDLDSMDVMNLVAGLSQGAGVDIPQADTRRLLTLRGLVDYLGSA